MIHFKSISECAKFNGLPEPRNPYFLPLQISKNNLKFVNKTYSDTELVCDFYTIALKRIAKGTLLYGKTKYDYSKGVLLFLGPGQKIITSDVEQEFGGFSILFNKEYFLGHPLFNSFNKYSFFDYSLKEMLELSSVEEKALMKICENIQAEYNNIDEYSRNIIISYMETLLQYIERSYDRQFKRNGRTKENLNQKLLIVLNKYADQNGLTEIGSPNLSWLANELAVSQRYLSDCIKAETGKTVKDQINIFLIERAKNLLLSPNISISETAFKLGFRYPQYFTRLFKKKTGLSPSEFIKAYS